MSENANTLQLKNAGFYNSFASALNLSPQSFQLIQGVLPVSQTASDLYNIFDGVPPLSLIQLYTANPVNKQSGNYLNMLDQYTAGKRVQKAADGNYDNKENWIGGSVTNNPKYVPEFSTLKENVNGGSSVGFTYVSDNSNTGVEHSWAKNTGGAGIGFWGEKTSSEQTTEDKMAYASNVTVEVHIHSFAFIPINFGGWFTSAFMTSAYQNPGKGDPGWAKDGQWQKFFEEGAKKGSWQRAPTSVLLVNGYKIITTSQTKYTASQYEKVSTQKEINVWPFYTKTKKSVVENTYSQTADGYIRVVTEGKSGNYQIMGFGVNPMSELIGS